MFPIGDYDDLGEYEVDGPGDWDPYQCTECGHWTEHGSVSELDDEFVCDECALDIPHRYGGDCE
ncbi:MAG: hypothetical protein HOY79_28900 [Streptomyces sp.]|nr:hypothetical protein [Streptomyces sp.]